MKQMLFSICLLLGSALIVNAQTLEEKIAEEMCACVNSPALIHKPDSIILNNIGNCFRKAAEIYKEELRESVQEIYDTTSFVKQASETYGAALFNKQLKLVIKNCDRLYVAFDDMRSGLIKNENPKTAKKAIRVLSKKIKKEPYSKDLYERATLYTSQQKFDQAKQDLDSAIKLNDHPAAYLLRAYILELEGDLLSAYSDYTKAYQISGNENFLLFLYIVERKIDIKKKAGHDN